MRQRWLGLMAVMASAAFAAAGCDRPSSSITGPTVPGPRLNWVSGGYQLGSGYLLTGAGSATQTRSAVIGIYGGKINFGATTLQIPGGAVKNPTRFTFVLQTQPYMAAKLSAVDTVTKLVVDRFPMALTLTLSYAGSKTDVPDPSKLHIVYIKDGKLAEILSTSVEVKGKKLIAPIVHFSDYSPWTGIDDQQCGTTDTPPCP